VNTLNVSADSTPARSREGVRAAAELGGRVLLATIFLASGVGKVGAYAATAGYMQASGVPGALLPLVIAAEIIGGLAVTLGWQTRIAAFALAGFSLLAAALFHSNFADQIQMILFLKNVAIAGGFLLLVANGPGRLSVDSRLAK
jgi:putative oxidoreductase